ncbi:MAG: DivIVA domain-containing protein [Solirubrobacteraceae bacterium]
MALDRQSIEKRDFPIGRRGYEPANVDAHLASVASEVEALQQAKAATAPAAASQQAAPSGVGSLASIASVQVQAIVEAAEQTASSIESDARDRAAAVEQDAAAEAKRIRDEAIARSQEHIGQVHEATSLMLQRVDAMESELGALVDSLRTGANRVSADLYLVSSTMGELYQVVGGSPESAPAPVGKPPPLVEPVAAFLPGPEPEPEPEPEPPTASPAAEDDVEGARLIALNMALNGQTREETDRYLADNFSLSDRPGLLDEVYATVEG